MPKIPKNISRSQSAQAPTKPVAKSDSSMSFSRISSTSKMPETVQSNSEQASSFHPPAPSFASEKIPSLTQKDEDVSSSGSGVLSALQKEKSEITNLKDVTPPQKVSDIIHNSQALLDTASGTKTQEESEISLHVFRGRMRSLPVIQSELLAASHALNMTKNIQKIEMIGHLFQSENLLFSDAFQKTANKYGVVIGLRSPSASGQIHLTLGYPTKNFHVKAKSSSTGPTAGFVPENPKYSKVGSEKWKAQEGYIKEAVSKGAVLVDLTLNEVQIKSAVDQGCMTPLGDHVFSANYHGETSKFTILPPDNMVRDENGEPVKVLTNPPESDAIALIEKAITPDYDLFCIVPKINQDVNLLPMEVGNHRLKRRPEKESNGSGKVRDYVKNEETEAFKDAMNKFTEPRSVHGEMDIDKGNLHFFAHVIIDDINKNVKTEGFTGGKLVWHGEENANPYSAGFDVSDKPVFFIPGQPPQQIESKSELRTFFNILKLNGFAANASPKFTM